MFPKKGKVFPGDAGRHTKVDYAVAIATALRNELGETHQAIKAVMKWTGANERTVKNWFAGSNGPNGQHLAALARHSDAVFEAFLILASRRQALVTKRLVAARDALVDVHRLIDALVNEGQSPP
jgi:hypothetical protein